MGIRRGSISTPIIADGLVFNMDAANRASYVEYSTTSYNTTNLSISGSIHNDPSGSLGSPKAWDFDGVDSYINIGNHSSIMIRTGDFTISGWIKIDGTNSGNKGMIAKNGVISTTSKDYLFGIQGMKLIVYAGVGTGGTWGGTKLGATTLSSDTWYYIACTLNRDGNIILYLNGASDGSAAMTSPTVDITSVNNYDIGTGDGNYFDGKIGLVQLYNRALSANEVLHNYNALKGRFT